MSYVYDKVGNRVHTRIEAAGKQEAVTPPLEIDVDYECDAMHRLIRETRAEEQLMGGDPRCGDYYAGVFQPRRSAGVAVVMGAHSPECRTGCNRWLAGI